MDSGLFRTMGFPPYNHIILTFVKSGNDLGGFLPTLDHLNRCDGTIPLGSNRSLQKQRIFGSENFSGKRRCSYVLLECVKEGNLLWTVQIQYLFLLRLKYKNEES